MSESNFAARVRKGLERFPGHWQRVESATTGSGVPDVNFCFRMEDGAGVEGWVELKHGKLPARETTVVFKSQRGLDPEQVAWLHYRWKMGGRCFILTQLDDFILLHTARQAHRYNHLTWDELRGCAVWVHKGAMKPDDWGELHGWLTVEAF